METEDEFRGLLLGVLELIADGEAQLRYQNRAPVNVSSELFNLWDDAYHPDSAPFRSQFDSGELAALEEFGELIDEIADDTPQCLPPLEEFMKTKHWQRLEAGARRALAKMDTTRRDGLAPR